MAVKITYTEDLKYGIPQLKKYPMPDKKHVISAIKFFNYVTPKYEKQLAKAILARMNEYGMSFDDIGVGEDNRFSKYIPEQALAHHGILGMKWGVRRYQNKDGSLTDAGKKHRSESKVSIRDALNHGPADILSKKYLNPNDPVPSEDEIKRKNDEIVKRFSSELLGINDYHSKRGKEAAVTGLKALNKLGKIEYSDDEINDKNNWEWFLFEDQTIGLPQIADLANKGLSARQIKITSQMARFAFRNSNYYPYGSNENDANDKFIADAIWNLEEGRVPDEFIDACVECAKDNKELKHHGILGQKWGVRRYQKRNGSLTEEGKRRYQEDFDRVNKKEKKVNKSYKNFMDTYHNYYKDSMRNKNGSFDPFSEEGKQLERLYKKYVNSGRDYANSLIKLQENYGYKNIPSELIDKGYTLCKDFSRSNWGLVVGLTYIDYSFPKDELKHHGILGQKWGIRRYQNDDGSLTPAGIKRRAQQIDKDNSKFLKKYGDTINKKVERAVEPYMKIYAERELNTSLRKLKKNGRDSRNYINAYNKRLAQLMNTAVGDLRNPKTDYVVQFIAKRGEYGVHTALAAPGTDMSRYKSGVYGDGRIAYRKEGVKQV